MSYEKNIYTKIYNKVYTQKSNYNYHNIIKDAFVDVYVAYINGKILDAGCGEGIHLKRILKNGYNAFGIELSQVCCQRYLTGTPHANTDIISFAKENKRFDGLICMDVLEHIPPANIKETLAAISNMSDSAFLGIANHSDIICGEELHLIQESKDWWIDLLEHYYKNVHFIASQFAEKFFYIVCSNEKSILDFYKITDCSLKLLTELSDKNTDLSTENTQLNNSILTFSIENTQLKNNISALSAENTQLKNGLQATTTELLSINNSRGYKLLNKYWSLKQKLKGLL